MEISQIALSLLPVVVRKFFVHFVLLKKQESGFSDYVGETTEAEIFNSDISSFTKEYSEVDLQLNQNDDDALWKYVFGKRQENKIPCFQKNNPSWYDRMVR